MSEQPGALRSRRMRMAAGMAMLAKLGAVATRLLGLPVVFGALGPERFGLYSIVLSALTWLTLQTVGVGQALTRAIAAGDESDGHALSMVVTTALFITVALTLTVGAAVSAAEAAFGLSTHILVGAELFHAEALTALRLLFALMLVLAVAQVAEFVQEGLLLHYQVSVWRFCSHVASLGGLVLASLLAPTIPGFVLAMAGPTLLMALLNGGTLVVRLRPRLALHRRCFDWRLARRFLGEGVWFGLIAAASLIVVNLSVLVVGGVAGLKATATFSLYMNAAVLANAGVSMFTWPFWPALANALAARDEAWAHRVGTRLVGAGLGVGLLVAVIAVLFGEWLVRLWVGPGIDTDLTLRFCFAWYLVMLIACHVFTVILLGAGELRFLAVCLIMQAVGGLLTGSLLCLEMGAAGMFAGLGMGGALAGAWIMPARVRTLLPGRAVT